MGDLISFELHVDADVIASEVPSQRVLEMVITPPATQNTVLRPSLNLALVIDRSGSMSGEKLEYVKKAALHVLDIMKEQDRVAIITFDTEVTLLSGSVFVNAANRDLLKGQIKSMRSGNTTNLSGGWLAGCQEVAGALNESGVNRVLLLTDGLANVGITDLEELGMHAGQLLIRGVATSTFGVGVGFNEHLLEHMANQGGGKFYYIDSPYQIPTIFQLEFQEMLAITARNVEVELGVPAGVSAQVLGNWRNELKNDVLHIWLGDLPASQKREVYVKLLTPPSTGQDHLTLTAKLNAKDELDGVIMQQAVVTLRYVTNAEEKATPLRQDIMERFTTVEMADKSTEALKLERAGEREKAARLIEMNMVSSAPYMTKESSEDYRELSERMRRGMDEQDRKSRHQEEYLRKQRRG